MASDNTTADFGPVKTPTGETWDYGDPWAGHEPPYHRPWCDPIEMNDELKALADRIDCGGRALIKEIEA